jgi:peptidoglycan/LPS O-acetylase OafA/YrhL
MLPIGLASMWLIDRATRGALPRVFGHWSLARLGVMSYGMYVFHRYVMHYLGFDAVRGLHVFASVFAVSALLAIISWYAFERPINELKRFWPYIPRRPIVVPAGALRDVGVVDYAVAQAVARSEHTS